MAEPKIRLGLLTSANDDGDYYFVRAYPVVIGKERWDYLLEARDESRAKVPDDRIRNCGDEPYGGLSLNHLVVNAQGERNATPRRVYGWDVRYQDVYSVDRTTAERMARTLRTIDTRLDRLAAKVGQPATFGAYLAHVAQAIGADAFVRLTPGGRRGGWHSETDHDIQTIRDGIWSVDRLVEKWIAETAPVAVVA